MNSKIYIGEVTHARLSPVKHSFRYPVYFYAFDLAELSELARQTMLFGYNQRRPVALYDKDYLTPGETPVREKLEAVLTQAGRNFSLGKVILVTAARFFNYIFNPISFFYCHDDAGLLVCIVAQVRNTFGEMHLYLLDAQGVEKVDGRLRFCADNHQADIPDAAQVEQFSSFVAQPEPHITHLAGGSHVDADQATAADDQQRGPENVDQPGELQVFFSGHRGD